MLDPKPFDTPEPASTSPMPGLVAPFALVGGVAGWLVAALLANPLVGLAVAREPWLTALVGALVAAAVGALLRRWCRPASWAGGGGTGVRVAMLVLAGGAITGALVGLIVWENGVGFGNGAGAGLLGGILFLPVCALVVAAAQRAVRARMGSLVASCDRREVLATLASTMAVSTALAIPDWLMSVRVYGLPFDRGTGIAQPVGAAGVAAVGVAVTLALLVADLRARAAIVRAAVAAEGMVPVQEGSSEHRDVPAVDLGLGDATLARIARQGVAYRGHERTVALLVGEPRRALAAVRASLRNKVVGIAASLAVLGAHALASYPRAGVAVEAERCERGSTASCARAARLLRALRVDAADDARAADLLHAACIPRRERSHPVVSACVALAEMLEQGDGVDVDTSRAAPLRERGCGAGDGPSCRARALTLLRTDDPARDLPYATELLGRACGLGATEACPEARVLEDTVVSGYGATNRFQPLSTGAARCLRGDALACDEEAGSDAAAMYRAHLFELACSRGRAFSCREAAAVNERSLSNPVHAFELYRDACDRGDAFACCESAYRVLHDGRFVVDARESFAAEQLRRAAQGGQGDAGSCALVRSELPRRLLVN